VGSGGVSDIDGAGNDAGNAGAAKIVAGGLVCFVLLTFLLLRGDIVNCEGVKMHALFMMRGVSW
jgi:hypothetical protein